MWLTISFMVYAGLGMIGGYITAADMLDGSRELDLADYAGAGFIFLACGSVWPLFLILGGIGWAVKKLTRK